MYRIPRYTNKPLTFVGLEHDELIIGFLGLFYAFAVKSFLILLIGLGLTALYVKVKRKNPPGFFKHILYMVSMFELDHYPDSQRQEFIE